tara:strand:- start:2296 stop:3177 length:882 start_codon:yes stop_codon:yes gene_type:complete
MANIITDDGVSLYYESYGAGTPIVFVHEFGGNYWSWEPQIDRFSRRHQCVTFAARGYRPSQVPESIESYSQARAAADIAAIVRGCGFESAHIVGLSMGGFAALHFALDYPQLCRSALVAGTGYGAEKQFEDYFRGVSEQVAQNFQDVGPEKFAPIYAEGASRVQFQNKSPRHWRIFADRLGQHDAIGAANTMRGVQMHRPSIYDLEDKMKACNVPVLIMTGDEDDHCLQPGIFMKKSLPAAGLTVLPKTGHTLNIEEPELFNALMAEFIADVEAGAWKNRDARANPAQIMRTD